MPRKRAVKVKRSKKTVRKKVSKKTKNSSRQLMELPVDTSVGNLVDWLEVSVWAQSDQKISREEVLSILSFGRESVEVQDVIDGIWDEIRSRMFSLQDKYPFVLSSNEELFSLSNTDSLNVSYIFCLVISYFGLSKLTPGSVAEGSYLFEKLCTFTAEKYVSDGLHEVQSIQFGAPRKEWDTKHKPFPMAVNQLVLRLGHGSSQVTEVRNTSKTVAHGGDGGLDVVAWRPFSDARRGCLILFGQCAAVKKSEDYMSKVQALDTFMRENVSGAFPRLFVFFLPHTLTANDPDQVRLWHRIISHDNVPFDRNRIALYGNTWSNVPATQLLSKWKKKIKKDHALV